MAESDPIIVQSRYSLRVGTLGVDELLARAAESGRPAVVLADQNSLWGLPELHRGAARQGVIAIPGCTLTVVSPLGERDELILVAADPEGYQNLCHAVTAAHLGGSLRAADGAPGAPPPGRRPAGWQQPFPVRFTRSARN